MCVYGPCESLIKIGKIKVLSVASKERLSYLPNIPTFEEEGVDLIWGAFRGIAAPAGTPLEIIKKLDSVFRAAMETKEYIEKMNNSGYPIVYRNSEDFKTYIQNNNEALQKVLPKLTY